jgi:TRAP-type mannitol/chloroaromatic compound transport system permease small subunit
VEVATRGIFGRSAQLVAAIGRAVAWLTLFMVVLTVTIVLLRYGFSQGWIWLQESVTYLHATVFMLVAAWALQDDGHVRVDVLYRRRSERYRALVNLLGAALFLAPFCLFLLIAGWDYVLGSWRVMEGSREAGGLPLVYLLKSLILLLPALLLLQGACQAAAAVAVLRRDPGAGT